MSKTVEFWFDFGSPTAYMAWRRLPDIAKRTGATILWRPMLLGGVFKATGNGPPWTVAAKGAAMGADMQRWAKRFDITLATNPHFPINTLQLMRGAIALQKEGEAVFQRYVSAIYDAMWVHPRNLNDPAEVEAVLADAGFDVADFQKKIADPEVKDALKAATQEVVAKGAFGAPTFFVGDEMFFGQDRLDFVEEALA